MMMAAHVYLVFCDAARRILSCKRVWKYEPLSGVVCAVSACGVSELVLSGCMHMYILTEWVFLGLKGHGRLSHEVLCCHVFNHYSSHRVSSLVYLNNMVASFRCGWHVVCYSLNLRERTNLYSSKRSGSGLIGRMLH